jgi:HEAT repeat protein
MHAPRKLLTGLEPALGGDSVRLSGLEPILGGLQRPEADSARIQALIGSASAQHRAEIIGFVIRMGQSEAYVKELLQVIPARARQKVGGWRGNVTLTQRCLAIEALGQLGGAESLGPLLITLADSTYQVRQAAEEAIGAICERLDPGHPKTRKAVAALAGALGSPSLGTRKVAAQALARLPADLVLGPLLRDALASGEARARREAAWVLGQLGDRRATARLVEALADASASVRAAAVWALGRLDAPVAMSRIETLFADPDENVRAAAVEAYGALSARLSGVDDEFRPALDRLAALLKTETDLAVRTTVLEALAAIDAPEARIALHAILNR